MSVFLSLSLLLLPLLFGESRGATQHTSLRCALAFGAPPHVTANGPRGSAPNDRADARDRAYVTINGSVSLSLLLSPVARLELHRDAQ